MAFNQTNWSFTSLPLQVSSERKLSTHKTYFSMDKHKRQLIRTRVAIAYWKQNHKSFGSFSPYLSIIRATNTTTKTNIVQNDIQPNSVQTRKKTQDVCNDTLGRMGRLWKRNQEHESTTNPLIDQTKTWSLGRLYLRHEDERSTTNGTSPRINHPRSCVEAKKGRPPWSNAIIQPTKPLDPN